MQGIQVRGGEQSSRAFASKAPKAFQRPDPSDLMGFSFGLPTGLGDDDVPIGSRMPDFRDEMPPSRGAGLTAMPRSRSELGHREPSLLRDAIAGRDPILPRDTSGNFLSNSSVQLPGLNHSGHTSLRSSTDGRPSKTEGGTRKSVLWALDDVQPRAASAAPAKLEGALRMSADSGLRTSKGADVAAGDDLQTQINLLRERSWTEQQSLRRQIDDQKADNEKLKKELESANVRVQELQNEAASIKDAFDVAAAIEKNGSATALIEEKNAQIRHLESLARELASSGGCGISLQAPSRELANGGGSFGSIGMSALTLGKPSVKEQQLEKELQSLRAEREKEQDDLKELEQVVVVFETKMEALKKENRNLKRQTADLKSMNAQSMAAHAQYSSYQQLQGATNAESGHDSVKLERIIENMSIFMCSLHDRNTAVGSLIGAYCRWKCAAQGSRPDKHDSDHSVQCTKLEFQLKRAEQKSVHLKEEMEQLMVRQTNLLETEQAQGAMMAQRMLRSEELSTEKDKEISLLKSEITSLQQELDSSQRRLASTSAMLCSDEHGASKELQDQATLLHALEDDIASLKIVRKNMMNRLAMSRQVAVAKAVRDKDRSCLMHKFQVWRMLPHIGRHVPSIVFQSNRGHNKCLKIQIFRQWFEQACLMSKAELKTSEDTSREQMDYLKSKLAAEREAASSLSASHKESSARCEMLTKDIASLTAQQKSLMQDLNSGVSSRRQLEKLQPTFHELISGVVKIKDEMDMLQTMFQFAVSENQGLRESLVRITAERDSWFEERARIQHRQATGAGPGAADANATLLRDRVRVLTSKLDAAELEICSFQDTLRDTKKLSDELQALAEDVNSKGMIFAQKGGLRLRICDTSVDLNPVSRARSLAEELRTYFHGIWQTFPDESGPYDSVTGGLHSKVQELMAHLSDTDKELQDCRQEAKQHSDARQQEIAMLSSSLMLAKNEVKYLQDFADGGCIRDVYQRSIKSLETFISSLNKKYSRKVAECQGLERQLNVVMRSNIDKSQALDSTKRQLARFHNGELDSKKTASPSEQEVQMQLQDCNRDLDIAKEKLNHSIDASNALACEVQEMTALWRLSANEVFSLNDAIAQKNAESQGLRVLCETLRGQLKTLQDQNRALSIHLDEVAMQKESLSERLNKSDEKAEGFARELTESTKSKTLLESHISDMQASVQALNNKQLQEVMAREKAEKLLAECNASFECDSIKLRSKIATANKVFELTGTGLDSLCSDINAGMQSLALCISEQQQNQDLFEVRVQGKDASNETLTKHLQECNAAFERIQGENKKLLEDLAAMRNETDSLQDRLHDQSGQNISLTKEIRKLTTLKDDMEMEMKKLNETSESNIQQVIELKQRLNAATLKHGEECDELRDRIKSHDAELATQQKGLAEEKLRTATAQRSVQQLQDDLTGVRSALETANSSHAQLTQQLALLREENQKQLADFELRTSQLNDSQKKQATSLASTLQDLDRVKSESQKFISQIEELDTKLNEAQEQLELVTSEKAELQDSLDSQSNQTQAWLAKAHELERNVAAKDVQLVRLQESSEKAQFMQRDAEQSMQTTQKACSENIKSLQAELEKDRQEKAKLESEKMYLQERVQNLKSQLETALEDVREHEAMIEEIQNDAFMLQVQLLESIDCVQARDSTLEFMGTRLSTLKSSYTLARLECEKKQQFLDNCRAEADTTSQQLEKAIDKYMKLEIAQRELEQKHDQDQHEMQKAFDAERKQSEILSAKIQDLEGRLTSAGTHGEELEEHLQQVRAELVSLQQDLMQQSTANEQLEEKLTIAQHEKDSREKELHACASKLAEAGRVMEALHAEKERFRLKSMDLQRDLDASKSNLVEKESDYVELEGKMEHLNFALDTCKGALAEIERKFAAKNEEIEELQCQLTQVGAELSAATKEVDRHKIIHSKQMEEFHHVRQVLQDQAAIVVEGEEKIESLREELRMKEAAAHDLVSSLEQRAEDLMAQILQKESDYNEAKAKHAQVKVQYDALMTRCRELDEENARTTSKLGEYDSILQVKGKELAKMHGSLAEARSLAEDAELRVQSMKVMEDKLKRDLSSKDKQLKSLQQNLLDGSMISMEGGTESLDGNGLIASMEKEYSLLQDRFNTAQEQRAVLQHEANTAKQEALDLQDRLQNTELQVVSLKLEIETKQGELDGLSGKVSRLEQALAVKPDTDDHDDRSKATTARVTPTRGFEADCTKVHVDEESGAPLMTPTFEEFAALKRELEVCRKKLEEKVKMDFARLTVRCHKSLLRRDEEIERCEDLTTKVQQVREESQRELCDLQTQLVEKTDLLLASEKKFSQLLAWVQKNRNDST